MAKLVLPKIGGLEDQFELHGQMIFIGRDQACSICFSDVSVSRRHASILKTDDGYQLEDLGSKNCTKINGRIVQKEILSEGDLVQFGDVALRFVDDSDAETDSGISEQTFVLERDDLSQALLKLGYLYDLSKASAEAQSEEAVALASLEIVKKHLECDYVYMGILDEAGAKIRSDYHHPAPQDGRCVRVSTSVLDRAINQGQGVLVKDTLSDEDLKDKGSIIKSRARSVLCAPMVAAGKTFGVIYADSKNQVHPFSKDDLDFVGSFGALLAAIIQNVNTVRELEKKNKALKKRVRDYELIGDHTVMQKVRENISNFAKKGNASVLIFGESGTGKELAARLIHLQSSQAKEPFIAVNCAAVPRELMESELFGHKKGAFTSATKDRRGYFELAHQGTLFLDEIGEMPVELQAKLLRVLESGELNPLGAEKGLKVDVRVLTATNKDLEQSVKDGEFRKDLYYRLNVLNVRMPALREHAEDIQTIAEHFLTGLKQNVTARGAALSPKALQFLKQHQWPGNVRELRNALERALYACDDEQIGEEHFIELLDRNDESGGDSEVDFLTDGTLEQQINNLEKTRIMQALAMHKWNRTKAAAHLGIARKTIIAKIKKYDL